jgi:hypothetical protein
MSDSIKTFEKRLTVKESRIFGIGICLGLLIASVMAIPFILAPYKNKCQSQTVGASFSDNKVTSCNGESCPELKK